MHPLQLGSAAAALLQFLQSMAVVAMQPLQLVSAAAASL